MPNRLRRSRLVPLAVVFALVVAACGGDDDNGTAPATEASADASGGEAGSELSGTINVSGSSTVEPITTRAAELFNDNVAGGVEITVDGPGTGDGFAVFCAGETDISDASRPIKESEAEDCAANGIGYTELLIAFDGIAVMTNPNNAGVECLSFADLYALLGAEADGSGSWSDNDAVAAELGSTVAPYPDAELFISAPGTESGTYDSFVEIVLEDIGRERLGEDAESFVRQDFAGQADDNVIVQGIAGNDTSLGWVGFAFADENADVVETLAISEEPGGECVTPTVETIADGSYPVSRGLYLYVNRAEAAENPALRAFVDYYLGGGYEESVTRAFGDTGYVALPDDLLAATIDAWNAAGP